MHPRALACLVVCLFGCTGSLLTLEDATVRDAARSPDAATDTGASDGGDDLDAFVPNDVGHDAGPPDPCETALFCEHFDDYPDVDALTDGQRFGSWRAAVRTPGGLMSLDDGHTVSGDRALHMRIETGTTAGGRLFSDGDPAWLEARPTHLYGRMMMYIDPNGPSVHWTFFGASGDAEPSSPVVGRRATYLISSLPRDHVNTYSVVDGLNAAGGDPYHDCWFQSREPMATARWQCVSFELDSTARHLELTTDGADAPVLTMDDHGQGCVGDVVPDDAPWYGPAVDQIYVGAWSFHDMESPLEVWIDDLIVDDAPIPCPAP